MAAGIRHGVHDYEAMELSLPTPQISFGVLFNEATRRSASATFSASFKRRHLLKSADRLLLQAPLFSA
jgi:hypothetical protein